MENKEDYGVKFSGSHAASSISGALSGAIIAIGAPFIILLYGTNLGTSVQTGLVIGSLVLGGLISLVATVLGLAMPTQVNERPERDWRKKEKE